MSVKSQYDRKLGNESARKKGGGGGAVSEVSIRDEKMFG